MIGMDVERLFKNNIFSVALTQYKVLRLAQYFQLKAKSVSDGGIVEVDYQSDKSLFIVRANLITEYYRFILKIRCSRHLFTDPCRNETFRFSRPNRFGPR